MLLMSLFELSEDEFKLTKDFTYNYHNNGGSVTYENQA